MTVTAVTDHRRIFALDPEALRCPYPAYERLRAEAPVTFVDEVGVFVVSRYADVLDVLRRPDVFSSRLPTGPHTAGHLRAMFEQLAAESEECRRLVEANWSSNRTPVLQSADPPLHTRQRALVNRAFSPGRVKQLDDSIQEVCDELIDGFVARGEVELVHEFGVPLPLMVIARALGVRDGDLGAFKRWSDDFVVPVGNHNPPKERVADMLRSRKEFGDYFTQRIEERRRQPEDDLISDVVSARIDDEALTVPEMLGMFAQMLVAGNETTTKHIAWTVLMLCQDDALRSRVAADPSLVPQLVEESLRVESPVQGLYRTAVEDTEVAGVPIPAGSHLMLMYASGNRDPQQYPDPDVVDLDRANAKTHLAFGQGPHFCLGAALARAESRIAIETLLRRLPGLRLHPERHREEIEPSYVLHGLKELHLAFDPPAPA